LELQQVFVAIGLAGLALARCGLAAAETGDMRAGRFRRPAAGPLRSVSFAPVPAH